MVLSKNRQRWECHACNKVAFGSQGRAEETIENVSSGVKPVRAYPCPYGNGWHLTSQEVRT